MQQVVNMNAKKIQNVKLGPIILTHKYVMFKVQVLMQVDVVVANVDLNFVQVELMWVGIEMLVMPNPILFAKKVRSLIV